MLGKMGAAELFDHSQFSREPNQKDEEPLQTSQEAHHVNVEEILEEGIPSPSRYYTHYYVSLEEDLSISSLESTMAKSNLTQPQTSQFLRVPQIQTSFSSRVRSEPLIDYSHFQILTSIDHVGKLTQISEKKVEIERERARKQKEREFTKAKRDQERMAIAAAKQRKVADQEVMKITMQKWTKTAIREAGESMQRLVKSGCPQQDNRARLCMEALKIVKQNRAIAKARWDAKKITSKHGIPLGSPLPPLVEHPNFYCLVRPMRVEVSPWQLGCRSSAGFRP